MRFLFSCIYLLFCFCIIKIMLAEIISSCPFCSWYRKKRLKIKFRDNSLHLCHYSKGTMKMRRMSCFCKIVEWRNRIVAWKFCGNCATSVVVQAEFEPAQNLSFVTFERSCSAVITTKSLAHAISLFTLANFSVLCSVSIF